MISKELLSLVLGFPFASIQDTGIGNNILEYTTYQLPTHKYKSINLDTLGRLCKEWCFSKQFILSSYIAHCDILGMDTVKITSISEDTELEAIIKATTWVANEKGLL